MLPSILLIFASLLIVSQKRFKIDNPLVLFSLFYMLVYAGGHFFILLIDGIGGYKLALSEVSSAAWVALVWFLGFLGFYHLFQPLISKLRFPSVVMFGVSRTTIVKSRSLFLILGLGGLLAYIGNNGLVLLKVLAGGYEVRNQAAAGSGVYNILMAFGFKFFIIAHFLSDPRKYRRTLLLSIIVGVAIFFAIGGSRASSLMLVVTIILAAYHYRYVKLGRLILLGVASFSVIVYMALVRYNTELASLDSAAVSAILYQVQGSFSPIDSFIIIMNDIGKTGSFVPEVALNNLMALIPRAMWEGKPLILDNAAGYYTKEILNYGSEVTISPTLLGEFFLYGGYFGLAFGAPVVALIVAAYEKIYTDSDRSAFLQFVYFALILSFFGMMRDGVAVLIVDLIFFAIVMVFFLGAALFYRQIVVPMFSRNVDSVRARL